MFFFFFLVSLDKPQDSNNPLSAWAIIGIVLGTVIALMVIGVVIVKSVRMYVKKKHSGDAANKKGKTFLYIMLFTCFFLILRWS